MKKLALIFLLLGSMILPGCGADYEDESPQVVWTSPTNGTVDYLGKEILVSFDTEMMVESITLSSVYVIDDTTSEVWPLITSDPESTGCEVVISAVDPGAGQQTYANRTFLFDIDDTCILTPTSNLTLVVSQNVRSESGQTLEAPYRAHFTTGNL